MFNCSAQPSRTRFSGFIVFAVAVLLHLIIPNRGETQEQPGKSAGRSPWRATPADAELARLRADVIEKMKESRGRSEKLLALYAEEKQRLSEQYEQRWIQYQQGIISRTELGVVERSLAQSMARIEEVKRWIMEDDIAITEATMRDELLRLPGLAIGGYSESSTLIRFNGGALWSLADAPKIEKFFTQTFGRALPISAYGQTATHDRLRFDHQGALDVALHPDSNEGRSLLAHLRHAGIPFIAFRNAMPGAATGAHIHIGKPSFRTVAGAGARGECCKR